MDDEELDHLHKLMELLEKQAKLHAQIQATPEAWEVQDGSSLEGDDAKSHPHEVAHAAWLALTVSLDHLVCLRSSLLGLIDHRNKQIGIQLHTHAQAALARGGLENAARAVWLLSPADRITRVTRRLALQRSEIRASHKLRSLVPTPAPRTKEQALEKLIVLLTTVTGTTPEQADRILKAEPASPTAMVRDAGPHAGFDADTSELLWSIGSSLAHGDTHGTVSLLDKQIVERRIVNGRDIALARVTGSVRGLYYCTLAAVSLLNTGHELYEKRRTCHLPT